MTALKIRWLYVEVTFYFDVFTKEMLTFRCGELHGDRNKYIDGLEDVKGLLKGQTEPAYLHTDKGSVYSSMAYSSELSIFVNQLRLKYNYMSTFKNSINQ